MVNISLIVVGSGATGRSGGMYCCSDFLVST